MSNYPTLQQEFTAVIDTLMTPWVQVLGTDWADGLPRSVAV